MGTGGKRTFGVRTRSENGRETRLFGRFIAVMTTALIVIGGILFTSQAATAAPTVTYPGAISNLAVTSSSGAGTVSQWQAVRVTGDWAVPEGAVAGETFGMTLPDEFKRRGPGTFDLADPVSGAVLATCVVTEGDGGDLVCTLTAAVEGLENVGGSFWMEVTASRSTTEETVSFDLGNTFEVVDLPGTGGIRPEDLTEPSGPYKYASATAVEGRMRWSIGIPSSAVLNGGFTITDALDRTKENHRYTGQLKLSQRPIENGQFVGEWTVLPASTYTVSFAPDMLSFTFSVTGLPEEGFAYGVEYLTEADGVVLPGDVFGNRAVVNTTRVAANHTVVASGGGDGEGVAYSRFAITKVLSGAQADAAADATFTVSYTVKGSDAPATTMSVPVGETIRSDRAPLGSTFVVEEIDLPEIAGVSWGEWTITGEGVVAGADGTYEVTPTSTAGVELTLTNVANAVVGSVSWSKTDDSGAVLAGSEWTLSGPGGDLVVVDGGAADEDPANGAFRVTGLALGEYTLTETRAPVGYELLTAPLTVILDAANLEVSFGAIVNVKTPTPEVPPVPEAPLPPTGDLALTGGAISPLLPISGIVLVFAGLLAAAVATRRRRALLDASELVD